MKLFLCLASVVALGTFLTRPTPQPGSTPGLDEKLETAPPAKELGRVTWLRNSGQIQSMAKKEAKPIFMLFQEVPG